MKERRKTYFTPSVTLEELSSECVLDVSAPDSQPDCFDN